MIWITLNDSYNVERFVPRLIICPTFNDLYYFELLGLRWMICSTLNDVLVTPPHSSKESNPDLVLPLNGHLLNVLSLSTSHIQIVPFPWKITLVWVPGALMRVDTVKSFILTSELISSWFRNIFGHAPENGNKNILLRDSSGNYS